MAILAVIRFHSIITTLFALTTKVNSEELFTIDRNSKNIKNGVLRSFYTTSLFQCVHRCRLQQDCQDTNFNLKAKECELLGYSDAEVLQISDQSDWVNVQMMTKTTKSSRQPSPKRTIDDDKEITISRGNLAYIIEEHNLTWKLSFNLTLLQPVNYDANIVQMKLNDGTQNSFMLFVTPQPSGQVLKVCHLVDISETSTLHCIRQNISVALNNNLQIKIRNYYITLETKQALIVSVDDMDEIFQLHSYLNSSSSLKLYLSSPDFDAATGKISQVKYQSGMPFVNISKGNLVDTIQRLGKTWYVNILTRIPVKSDGVTRNLFHFSNGGNFGTEGERIPGLFLSNEDLQYRFDLNNMPDSFKLDYNRGSTTDLIYIRIEQIYDNVVQKFRLKCYFNGQVIQNIINNSPREFENVNVWLSNPWIISFSSIPNARVFEFQHGLI